MNEPAIFLLPPLANIQQLRDGMAGALLILMMYGFGWGVVKIMAGANAMSKGDPEGKSAILAGAFIAGSTVLMGVLFSLFGLQDAVITPHF